MNFRDRSEFFLFQLLVRGLKMGSPSAAHDLMEKLGLWLAATGLYRRGLVRRQLARAFPALSSQLIARMADQVFAHLGRTVGEVFHPGPAEQPEQVAIQPGWGVLDEALARGNGAIIASAHVGNFELAGAVVAARYSLLDVVKPQRNPLFDEFIDDLRKSRGILTVPAADSGMPVLRHLRSGGVVSLLLDQDAGNDGIPVDFFGRPASTWPGVARLSLRTGCPVVPLVLFRRPTGGHQLHLGDALWPEQRNGPRESVAEYLQEISLAVESLIRLHPEQWFWVHRRWKHNNRENRSHEPEAP
jgi:lauroyl/myristoyl acyltransferase